MNAVMHPEGLPQLKIRPEHLALAAIVYVFSDSLSGLLCQGRCQRKSVVL